MTVTSRDLASGKGWTVRDVTCVAGPQTPRVEEQHDRVCMAIVTGGTFQYRTRQGEAMLTPGAVMLGQPGACYECGHEHAVGDHCLAFLFTTEWLERVASDVRGVRTLGLDLPRLPPIASLAPLTAAAESAAADADPLALEEAAVRIAGAVPALLAGVAHPHASVSRNDARRITRAVRRIETDFARRLTIAALARTAGMSAYHFLRVFRAVVGMAPHQYVLHTRLRAAAHRLRGSDEPVSAIAFDCGFEDLSTFNRRFRRAAGMSPTAYRAAR